jgi:hypothetical protein
MTWIHLLVGSLEVVALVVALAVIAAARECMRRLRKERLRVRAGRAILEGWRR